MRDADMMRFTFRSLSMEQYTENKKLILVILLLGVVVPIFLQLGGRGLNEPDEGRYAEMGREMLVTGDWLVPRLNGAPHYAKPPWIYWCVASSLKIFGVNEWAARLPSALAAVATALMVFALGKKMRGPLTGLISALALVGMLLFFGMSRLITADMMLLACITAALFCFWSWWSSEKRSWRWLLGMYLALGIGFLDKGPVCLVVCLITIIGFLLLQKKIHELSKLQLLPGLLLTALIALPWFLVLCQLNPDLYDFYLRGEIKDRLLEGRGRVNPWYYHFLWLPGDCWPWTFPAGLAVWAHFQWWRKGDRLGTISGFLLAWLIFPMIFFSFSRSKLPPYILPALPVVGLMLGLWLARLLEEKTSDIPGWAGLLTCILLPAPLLGVHCFVKFRSVPDLVPFSKPGFTLIAGAVAAMGLAGLIMWLLIRAFAKKNALRVSLIVWWFGGFLVLQAVMLRMERFETLLGHNSSWRSLARVLDGMDLVGVPIRDHLHPDGRKPEFVRPGPRVVMYELYFRSGSFYLMKDKREVVPLFDGGSLWEIQRDRDAEAKLFRSDLVELLKGAETVFVFTRPQYHTELQELTDLKLPVIKTAASGSKQIVLFSNKPLNSSERSGD